MRRSLTGLFLLLILPRCAAMRPLEPSPAQIALMQQFKSVQDDWNNRHYDVIVQREGEVSCQTGGNECGALHLMTGDACFQTFHYPCAADHLEHGIAQAPQETFKALGMNHIQIYVMLMESLRSLKTPESPAALSATRLRDAALAFHKIEPSHPAGPFFMGIAQLTLLREARDKTQDGDLLCQQLSEGIEALQKGGPLSSSIRDITHYRQLLSDMALAQQGLPKCGP